MCREREREREETINNNNNRELQVAEQYYIYTDVRACNLTYIYSSIYIFNILLYILPRNHDEIITTKVKHDISYAMIKILPNELSFDILYAVGACSFSNNLIP